jgi:hypothetical protein
MAEGMEIFSDALNEGLILTKFNLCCPDCNGPYTLNNFIDFESFFENYNVSQIAGKDVGELCCLSLFVNSRTWLQFSEDYIADFPNLDSITTSYGEAYTQCGSNSDFMFYINQLSVLLGIEAFSGINFIENFVEQFGIVEINTINGHSGLKFIYDFLSSTGLTQAQNQELFLTIVGIPSIGSYDKGLVIRCVNDNILMSHTAEYFEFLSSYTGSNLYLCLKTERNTLGVVTTYEYADNLPETNLVNGKYFYIIPYTEGANTGTYYVFWSSLNNRWEVWSGFNSITNTGVGIFHSSLSNSSLDIYLTTLNWTDQVSNTFSNVIDSSLKTECAIACNFR